MSGSPPVVPVVASPAAVDTCAAEPWAWLPDDVGLARMAIDAEAMRASRYADAFVRHFRERDAGAVVEFPMRRMAIAYHAEGGGSVVVMRTGLARDTGLPLLAEDVVAVTEGSMTDYRPTLRCGAPEEGLAYAVFPPASIPQLRVLALIGLAVKNVSAKMWMDDDVLLGEVVVRFLAPLEEGPILDAFLRGLRIGVANLTSSVPEVVVEGSDITLRFVARTDAEAEQWIAHLARMTSDPEPEPDPQPMPPAFPTSVAPSGSAPRPPTPAVSSAQPPPATQGSNFGRATLAPGFLPDPHVAVGSSGGPVDARQFGPGCAGFVSDVPDHLVTLSGSFPYLAIMARSAGDVGLVVQRPDGTLHCTDDDVGTHPLFVGRQLPIGEYRVWVTSAAGTNHSYSLGVTELPSIVPQDLPPP